MPIYAPTLPPRPDLTQGSHPVAVLMRADWRRTLRHRIGIFFIFVMGAMLLVRLAVLYVKHLVATKEALAAGRELADTFLSKGPAFQAAQLDMLVVGLLWFLAALIGGAVISRDSLYRTRPLMYAHPVEPRDYLLAKGLFSAALPFLVMLPFVVLPWGMSLLMAGAQGPVRPDTVLRLLPAAGLIAALMGTVSIGVSSLAGTPRAGTGLMLGVYLGSIALGALGNGLLNLPPLLSLYDLSAAWPQLFCGVATPVLSWAQAALGTALHLGFWTWMAWTRTRPSEATL